jgi:hypothetical protein
MRISTFGEFYSLVNNPVFSVVPEIADFLGCVSQFNSTCKCNPGKRNAKLTQCNTQYITIVTNTLPSYKTELFNLTPDDTIDFLHTGDFFIAKLTR